MERVWMLLLLLLPLVRGPHTVYQGTVMSYSPVQSQANGDVTVEIRTKWNSNGCYSYSTACPPQGCLSGLSTTTIDQSDSFCQVEYIQTGTAYSNSLVLESETWEYSGINEVNEAEASIQLELKTRSDTGQPNSSPQTTILPIVRVAANCPTELRLLSFDPDGDLIQCRFADKNMDPNECDTCSPPSVLSLSTSCTLQYTPDGVTGRYVVQLVMEDFPQSNMNLTFPGSPPDLRTINNTISKIPLQFYLEVEPSAASCIPGQYRPMFVEPTPEHGAQIVADVCQLLQIDIQAEAGNATVSELVFSGPSGMEESGSGGHYVLSWTPKNTEKWRRFPVCFSIRATSGSDTFTSELRCVIVSVEYKQTITVLQKLWMFSSAPLSDTAVSEAWEEQLELELQKRGIQGGVTVKLSKVTAAAETNPTQPGPDLPEDCPT